MLHERKAGDHPSLAVGQFTGESDVMDFLTMGQKTQLLLSVFFHQ